MDRYTVSTWYTVPMRARVLGVVNTGITLLSMDGYRENGLLCLWLAVPSSLHHCPWARTPTYSSSPALRPASGCPHAHMQPGA
jgi:hypothetical protein